MHQNTIEGIFQIPFLEVTQKQEYATWAVTQVLCISNRSTHSEGIDLHVDHSQKVSYLVQAQTQFSY
jgi:hypothetical protein